MEGKQLSQTQSPHLANLGLDLRSCLGLETGTIHNFLCLSEVLEDGCRLWRRLLYPQGYEPGDAPPPHIPGFQGLPSQEVTVTPGGRGWSMPSQYTPPSLVSATLVKRVLLWIVAMALGLVVAEVPGATPKKPFSGLMARSRPVRRSDRKGPTGKR